MGLLEILVGPHPEERKNQFGTSTPLRMPPR